jgi:hypothetical protein
MAGPAVPICCVELTKAEDSAGVVCVDGRTEVAITSRSGIGGATLICKCDTWPAVITLNLKLHGLESIQMDNGLIRFEACETMTNEVPYYLSGSAQDAPQSGVLSLAIQNEKAFFSVQLPVEILKGNPERIHITWIDFYR